MLVPAAKLIVELPKEAFKTAVAWIEATAVRIGK